jgi:hypothetical protein
VFAIILILVGAVTIIYISIFGLLLLFPAILTPSRQPPQRKVGQRKEEKVTPPPSASQPPVAPRAPPATMEVWSVPMPSQPLSNSALFPNTMFPTISLMPQTPSLVPQPVAGVKPVAETRHEIAGQWDELLELGLLLAILMAAAG